MNTSHAKSHQSDKGNRSVDWNSLRLLSLLTVPAVIMAAVLFLWPEVLWVAEIPYTAIGILGSFVAIILSIFIIARYRDKPGVLYISAGLMAIGVIDGLQSVSPPGSSLFVWLHTFAGIYGSLFFILYVLSQMKFVPISPIQATAKNIGLLLAGVTFVATLSGILLMVFAPILPAMVEGARFTNLAWIINTIPVGLFLFSGIYLFCRYRITWNRELFLFTSIVIFLFQASEVFYFATLWGIIWWFWLALRLVVYLTVLSYVLKEYIQTSNHLSLEIIERKKVEEALRESDNNWRNSFNSLEEVMLIINSDYSISNINNAGSAFIDKEEEEILNRKCHLVLYARDEPCQNCPFQQTLKSRQVTSIQQFDEVFKRHFNIKTSPIFNEKGEIVKFVYLIIDITGRIKTEEKEKMLQRELNLTSRLASIGEIAAGIAHEINNPLTSVIAFAQMLTKLDVSEEIKEAVDVINDGAGRIAGIVEKLHTFARRQRPEKEYADINSIISSVIQMRSYEMRNNNIEVRTRLSSDVLRTMANIGQIQQVFLNIIINAEQAMSQSQKNGELLISTTRIDNEIRISITDNGPGISADNLDKLFDPFFTTKDVDGGTGLGLSISYGIIKEHGGSIYANSVPGDGATFTIDLPIVPKQEQTKTLELESGNPEQIKEAKIMVIDDEPHIRRALERLLTQEGHKVTTMSNAQTALEKLKKNKFDLILLDIKMPGMNGITFYKKMKEIAPALQNKVVCITGDIISPENKAFLNATGIPCITKPFGIEVLMKQVKSVIGGREANA
ncbi:MAG: response regulator [Dehalococcoidales bacterium]